MNFTFEKSRNMTVTAQDVINKAFGTQNTPCDAEFLDASKETACGVCGLPYPVPVTLALLNSPVLSEYVNGNTLFTFGDKITVKNASGKKTLASKAADELKGLVDSFVRGAGTIGEKGEHIIDLKAETVGLHYNVNLLLGNRTDYPNPLISTPKSALDALGRGSFRADASRQVLATRYDLRFEDNGEPTNRQFYIYENGKQIFYSANPDENCKTAFCRHMANRTVIEYETGCGLKITRTIFIMPQDDDMPEAVEAQKITIENTGKKPRNLKVVATGNFGLCSPESMMNDLVYASITHEGCVLSKEGKVIAVAPSSFPKHLVWQKRFACIFHNGEPLDEFCTTYNEFFGKGTIEHPEFGGHLSSTPAIKLVSFFAVAKNVTVGARSEESLYEFAGFTGDRTPELENFDRKLYRFTEKYSHPEQVEIAYRKVVDFIESYSSYISVKSDDRLFDSYVNNNLPFQVLYQSFVSRSFAWTQKAYREIGFREIQDMYASVYYMCAMGKPELAKSMLSCWASNVHTMGYANHNFYDSGKEPGMCSDDGLWLVQGVYRYVSLTGDSGFLNEVYPVADGGERKLIDTMNAVVTYSGKISVGDNGFPLMDKADWNDTMKLDNDWIDGPEKEKRYKAQLEEKKQEYGVRFESSYSESVMNAFLLKIALDELDEMASLIGYDNDYRAQSDDLCTRLREKAWKNDFYARAMIGPGHEGFTYLGAAGDGLSADDKIDGTYFLNSFSWSVLSGVATEEQIGTMLGKVRTYLWTPAGLKLCTPAALEKLASGTAAGHYYPGDRENGGVFKHAAMMAVTAMFMAAKKVKDESLAKDLTTLAYEMIDKTIPYKTLESPYKLKGNPRFCTQFNNAVTGENCGPMLSGTASWLSLAVNELLGITYTSKGISVCPILSVGSKGMSYTVKCAGTVYEIEITKPDCFCRAGERTAYTFDGEQKDNLNDLPLDGGSHRITIGF